MNDPNPAYIGPHTPHRNVHVVRWEAEAAKRTDEQLLDYYGRVKGATRIGVIRRELRKRGIPIPDDAR